MPTPPHPHPSRNTTIPPAYHFFQGRFDNRCALSPRPATLTLAQNNRSLATLRSKHRHHNNTSQRHIHIHIHKDTNFKPHIISYSFLPLPSTFIINPPRPPPPPPNLSSPSPSSFPLLRHLPFHSPLFPPPLPPSILLPSNLNIPPSNIPNKELQKIDEPHKQRPMTTTDNRKK
jgi:hypothetical protein